jgi:hypothetical protein
MRLVIIIIMLFIGICSIESKLDKVNNNLEKIVKLLEVKGEAK